MIIQYDHTITMTGMLPSMYHNNSTDRVACPCQISCNEKLCRQPQDKMMGRSQNWCFYLLNKKAVTTL